MNRDEPTEDAARKSARTAILATGVAAAGAAALILLPKIRRALAGTLDLAEETARKWYDAAEDAAEDFSARTAGRREPEPERAAPRPEAAEPASKPRPAARARTRPRSGTTKSTSPGHVNPHNQKVVRRVGKSPSWKGQYTYELECFECGHRYGANGPDIEGAGGGAGRACPSCQGGKPGDPI